MEGAQCVPNGGDHAGSLLTNLNLQRNQAQFCDCVVRQGQTSNLLYPAHRCVLAASSPVLASILSSASALVELQAPCLSDSVLAHVLDYIYTGALPCTQSYQQYSSLFTAACYLEMDELRRTLETRVNHLQLSGSCTRASLERAWEETHGETARSEAERTLQGVNTGDQTTISSFTKLPSVVPVTAEMCRVFRMDAEVQHYPFLSARPAEPVSWLQSTEMQARTAVENKRSSAKEGGTSIREAPQQLCLMATSRPEDAQGQRREEQICSTPCCVDADSHVTPPSPSSPHPSSGAVPVIRHSSAATAAKARTGPPYHLVSEGPESNGRIFEDTTQIAPHNEKKQSFDYLSRSDDCGGRPEPGRVSQCLADRDTLPSTPNLTITEKHGEDPASVRHDNSDRVISQPLATPSVPVDFTCNPAFGEVEQSYHAHLHYHCLHREDAFLMHGTSVESHSHPGLSGRASDEGEGGPFSTAAQHLGPADQVLLLDISTKPPELLISYRYDKQGDWVPLGQGTSGNQGDGDAAETLSDNSEGGPVDRDADVKFSDRTSETAENCTPKCAPSRMLDSLHTPTSPTSFFCIPSAISANMPTIVSPQLSNHRPFQCSMCHRSFSQRGSLNRHMRSHLGIRPFPCPRCPMTFSRQYRVSEHMRVHQRCVLGNDFQKPPGSSTGVND